MAETVPMSQVEPGMRLVTSEVIGSDFGLPLVEPTSRTIRQREVREVRSKSNRRLWFTDGTKTPQIHGRTCWTLADE